MRAPDFWASDGILPRLLDPVGRAYGFAGTLRRRWVTPTEADIPVICVGNLTAGGAGKTPTAIAIVERLRAAGHHPHILSRGYGGRQAGLIRVSPGEHGAGQVGDEALLLARAAPTWVSADRVAGAAAAMRAGASHIVMDDGLQNPHLAKDVSIVVIDGGAGFGNRRLIPAGPLREPIEPAWSRIDAAILIGIDRTGVSGLLPPQLPVLPADLVPTGDIDRLKGRKLLAFAGIGRPEKFYATLREIGAEIAETRSFPDHHPYRLGEIEDLLARARQIDAACITTEKDHLRVSSNLGKSVEKLPVSVKFHAPDVLDRLLFAERFSHATAVK